MKVPSLIEILLLLGVCFSSPLALCGAVFPQEGKNTPIQNKTVDSQVEVLQDQIRQIERRLSILGPKHPNWDSTNKKLKELKAKLAKIHSPQSNPLGENPGTDLLQEKSKGNSPTEPAFNDPNRNIKRLPEKGNSLEPRKDDGNPTEASSALPRERTAGFPTISPETRWIYQTYAQSETSPYVGYRKTPQIVEDSGRLSGGWDRRFSQDLTRGSRRIVFVPASNHVYAIEYDPLVGISSLWSWLNSKESRKNLVLRTEGELLDFAFGQQIEESAHFYVLRRDKDVPRSIELLAVEIPNTAAPQKLLPERKLLATLTPDFSSGEGFANEFYFSVGPEGTLMVLSDIGFTSTISQDVFRCVQLDPLSMVFWDSDKTPNIQRLQRFWMDISGSNRKNERVILFTDEQIIFYSPQGSQSSLRYKGLDGRVLREICVQGMNLESLSIRGASRVFFDQNSRNSGSHHDLIFIADDQRSICRAQDFDKDAATSRTIAAYDGKILQLTKDPEGRLLILSEDGLFAPTSIDYPLSDNPMASRLSLADTGLFVDVAKLQPREFFWEYYPSVSSGCHGENSRYFVAFPEGAAVKDLGRQGWLFPEGTIFLQMPAVEKYQVLNSRPKSEAIRILVKSQGQWRHYIYPSELGSIREAGPDVGQRNSDAIQNSGMVQSSVSRSCWECHSRSFNDGIHSFHDSALGLIAPTGVLQSEYLRKVRLLSSDDFSAVGNPPSPSQEDSTQVLSEILGVVRRLQTLAPNWYEQEFRERKLILPLGTGLNDVERLLWVDAFMVTGDKKYHDFLIEERWWEFVHDHISEWVALISTGHADRSLYEDLYLDIMPSLICTHPETERANVYRLFAKAVTVMMNSRKSRLAQPTASSLSEVPSNLDSVSFDIAWSHTLLEYYGSSGAPWALQESKELMSGFSLPKEQKVVFPSDRVRFLRFCLLSLRAFELTRDPQFLRKSWEVWGCCDLNKLSYDETLEELALKAHCVLRFLFLEVDGASSEECLRILLGFESRLLASGVSGSQNESSVDRVADKLAISKALIESKRIIPELWMFRRGRLNR